METTLKKQSTSVHIGGITMSLNRFSKINSEPIMDSKILSLEDVRPATSAVLRKVDGSSVYVVDVFLYVPAQELQVVDSKLLSGGLVLKQNEFEETLMFLSYEGAVNVEIEDERSISARSFKIEYDATESLEDGVDLYHVQFEYALAVDVVSADAIYVSFEDFDPVAPRGTMVAVHP